MSGGVKTSRSVLEKAAVLQAVRNIAFKSMRIMDLMNNGMISFAAKVIKHARPVLGGLSSAETIRHLATIQGLATRPHSNSALDRAILKM